MKACTPADEKHEENQLMVIIGPMIHDAGG